MNGWDFILWERGCVAVGWAVTSHHLSKFMHHEPSGLGQQRSILAWFHVSRVILDELTPYHRFLICIDIYPEDVFPHLLFFG